MSFFGVISVSLLLLISQIYAIQVNVHLKLDGVNDALAVNYNNGYHQLLSRNMIFLNSTHQAHAILFLTDFDNNVQQVVQTVSSIVSTLPPCPINLQPKGILSGAYAFWMIEKTDCLQLLCDTILNATSKWVKPNQTPPDWVMALPEPERSLRIAYVTKYGSPNVFNFFSPHVTIMYDDQDNKTDIASAANSMTSVISTSNYIANILAAGTVGSYGTVLRGLDYGNWTLTTPTITPTTIIPTTSSSSTTVLPTTVSPTPTKSNAVITTVNITVFAILFAFTRMFSF